MPKLIHVGGDLKCNRHVIFVHGIGGNWKETWSNGQKDGFWPEWLSHDLCSRISVWSLSYEAPISRWGRNGIHLTQIGSSITELLIDNYENISGIVTFITHSLGGLVVKQAMRILETRSKTNSRARTILYSVAKMVFMATPHSGSKLSTYAQRACHLIKPTATLSSLGWNDPNLADLNQWYRAWSAPQIDHRVFCDGNAFRFSFLTLSIIIVEANSSDPGLFGTDPVTLAKNHFEIVKPDNRNDLLYKSIFTFLMDERRLQSLSMTMVQALERIKELSKFAESESDNVSSDIDIETTIQAIPPLEPDFDRAKKLINLVKDRDVTKPETSPLSTMQETVVTQVNRMRDQDRKNLENSRGVEMCIQAAAICDIASKNRNIDQLWRGIKQISDGIQKIDVDHPLRKGFETKLIEIIDSSRKSGS